MRTTGQGRPHQKANLMDLILAKIEIVTGQRKGAGKSYLFAGKRTARAINARLVRERAGGKRWGHALIDGYQCEEVEQ